MSGSSIAMPAQNSLSPPPEPVLSTTGVLYPVMRPNSSATAAEKGNTVDEPTIRIWSREAAKAPAGASPAARAATATRAKIWSWSAVLRLCGAGRRAGVVRVRNDAKKLRDSRVTTVS